MSIPLPKAPSSMRLPSTRVDALWDADAPKYRVCCRRVHVVKAATIIGYAQLSLLAIVTVSLLYIYGQAAFGDLPVDHWMVQSGERYLASLVMAVGLQLALVLMLIHGIRMGRRSLLLPFVVFATLAAFIAIFQMSFDYSNRYNLGNGHAGSALLTHFIGVLVHLWCIHVIWRCYCYLGDKKVAEHIGEQLQATSMAFSFEYAQPPAYAEATRAPTAAPHIAQEKRPLTVA